MPSQTISTHKLHLALLLKRHWKWRLAASIMGLTKNARHDTQTYYNSLPDEILAQAGVVKNTLDFEALLNLRIVPSMMKTPPTAEGLISYDPSEPACEELLP